MLCKVCGIGQRKKEGTAMKRCPHCNSPITQPDRKTCPVCGNPLSGLARRGHGAGCPHGCPWCCFAPWRWWSCTLPCTSLVTLPQTSGPGRDHTGTAGWCWTKPTVFIGQPAHQHHLFTLTVDGAEQPHGTSDTGRYYMARSALTRTDTLLRVVSPEGDGYRTALALVSKPSNENAAFGTFVPCEADGYAKPDEEYLTPC